MYGHDVPKRGVHRVELGRVALVREAVRQHALGDGPGPLQQDGARLVQPAGRETEAAQGDEGVPAPVAEPGIAGDDGLPFSTASQVGVRRAS